MDDLDHSMHIAEYDWMSFYEESEECGLLQPSLAFPDNSCLSDSEESRKSSSVFNIGSEELRQSLSTNSDEAESSAAGWCTEDTQRNHRVSEGQQEDLTTKAEEDRERKVKSDKGIDYPGVNAVYTEGQPLRTAEHNTVATHDDITTTLQTVQLNVPSLDRQSAELTKQYGDMQTESDPSSLREHGHVSGHQMEQNVNEPRTRDAARLSEAVGRATLTAEKERWFVTVDGSAAQRRSVKNKKKPRKTCKNNHVCQTLGQEKSHENGLKLEINNEPEGGRNSQSNPNSGCCAEEHPGSFQIGVKSDLSQISLTPDEGNGSSDRLVTSHVIEPMIDGNKHILGRSASASRDPPKAKDPSRLDSVESDELGDSVEFLSIHSCDSESYLSASESMEDIQHLLTENQQRQSSSSLLSPTGNTDADDTRVLPSHDALSRNATAASCELCHVKPNLSFPSAAQSVSRMPDDNSCDDTHGLQLCAASDTPALQKHDIHLSASGRSSGDELALPLVSVETLTLGSVVNSPETYAAAAGQARPVFAISAFWDEMEKMTINDILQLRTCRETLPSDTRETGTSHVEDLSMNCSPLLDTVEKDLSNAALGDSSDAADSDYCTQLDESKPDLSSCEFSTSDFEEEYWRFLVTSRNSSPDPHSENQPRTIDCPFFAREEESPASEGRETPVPSKERLEDQDSDALLSSTLTCPSRITKSRSVWNVQALNTEDLSWLGDDESSLFLNSCPSLEESVLLKRSDSLGTLVPAHFLANTTRCVAVYDPANIYVAPVFDYALWTFRDETSFSFLHDSQCIEKPIPIFSCHPTVKELTFSNQDYVLSADYERTDDVPPVKFGSRSFIQGGDCGMSAAALRGSCTLRGLLSREKISFHDKGSFWSRSGAWVFPVEAERNTTTRAGPPISVVAEAGGSSTPSQLCGEVAVQQRILETMKRRQEGIFSTLKQSDMCLVCIAFASWVLRSSDPEAADAWKAVLLANVSALSAIQYLRQYVKRNPSQGDP